jgi:hypothetical protein
MSRPFGPSGRLVERFLERLGQLGIADFNEVVRHWRSTLRDSDAWYAAEDAVGEAIGRTRRDGAMWILQDRIYEIFRGGTWYEHRAPGTPVAPSEMAAQYLANTAGVALLVADVLPAAELRTLYEPFRESIPMTEVALGQTLAIEPSAGERGDGERGRGHGELEDRSTWH